MPPPVPVSPPPVLGAGVAGAGVGVPPVAGVPDEGGVPVLGVPVEGTPVEPPPVSFAFLRFFVSPGSTGSPVVTGGVTGCTVSLLEGVLLSPPLEAIAITTMRKKATAASATSLRRRYTAGLSRVACKPHYFTRAIAAERLVGEGQRPLPGPPALGSGAGSGLLAGGGVYVPLP